MRKLVLCLSLICASPYAMANGHYYLGGLVGGSWANVSNSNPSITYYNNLLNDTYHFRNENDTEVLLGVNGGYEFCMAGMPEIAVGLGVYAVPADYNFKGQLIETADGGPVSTLYNFKYQIQSVRAMLEAKFSWLFNMVSPFIDAGIGVAWNRTYYKETPVDDTGYVALPPFGKRNNTNFAYQIGLGLGYGIDVHNWIALVYRFAGLGSIETETRGDVYPYSLNTGNLYSNEVYLTYVYKF